MKWNVVGKSFSKWLSMCGNTTNSPNGFVTRMELHSESPDKPSEGDVCYSISLVLLCTVLSSDTQVCCLSVGL